jgi:hypothetical protein
MDSLVHTVGMINFNLLKLILYLSDFVLDSVLDHPFVALTNHLLDFTMLDLALFLIKWKVVG